MPLLEADSSSNLLLRQYTGSILVVCADPYVIHIVSNLDEN